MFTMFDKKKIPFRSRICQLALYILLPKIVIVILMRCVAWGFIQKAKIGIIYTEKELSITKVVHIASLEFTWKVCCIIILEQDTYKKVFVNMKLKKFYMKKICSYL